MKKPAPALKQFPVLRTDEEAENFVANADLSEYDFSGFKRGALEFAPKDARINMRLPASLVAAVKAKAGAEGIPYQRYIRRALEASLVLQGPAKKAAPARSKESA